MILFISLKYVMEDQMLHNIFYSCVWHLTVFPKAVSSLSLPFKHFPLCRAFPAAVFSVD